MTTSALMEVRDLHTHLKIKCPIPLTPSGVRVVDAQRLVTKQRTVWRTMTNCVLSFVLWLYEEMANMSCLQHLTSASETSSILEHPTMDGERLHRPLEASEICSGVSLFLIGVTLAEAGDLVPRTNSRFTDATPHTSKPQRT